MGNLPGSDPNFGNTVKQAAYLVFRETMQSNDEAYLGLVDAAVFAAYVPGQGRLTLDAFHTLHSQLLQISPDFGQDVSFIGSVEEGDTLCVMYQSRHTVGGRLLEYTSVDWVTFGKEDRITQLRVFYDRAGTQEQAFGTTLMAD